MTETFAVALGIELRRGRERNGWTRGDLRARLPFVASEPTIGAWEYGTRNVLAVRLFHVCDELGEPAEDVIARVRARLTGRVAPTSGLSLDLTAAARTTRSHLHPIRAWAQHWILDHPDTPAVMVLDESALGLLAQLCQITTIDLTRQLARLELLTRPNQ